MNPKHIKVTNYSKAEDDQTIMIESKTYTENLSHHLVEYEKKLPTTFETLKKDLALASEHFVKDGSPQVVLTLGYAKGGKPQITKRWIALRENYKRR